MTPHQHQQLKQWAEDMRPLPGQGYLYDLLHEAIDAVVTQVPPPFYDPNEVAFTPETFAALRRKYERVASESEREPTHAEAYAALNPKVGERFRVVRKVNPDGWVGGWTAHKEACIGCRWLASSVEPDHGVYLTGMLGTGIGYFPANALERVMEA